MEKDKINIELKSEVLNEVLSAPPSWLVRSGNTLFFFFILLLLALSWMISYPDELMGEVNIHSNRPPVEFENQMYGKLVDLQVKDQQIIEKGKVLAQFDNEINPKHIEMIQTFLLTLKDGNSMKNVSISAELEKVNLGTLQQSWMSLLSLIKERNDLTSSDFFQKKIASIQNEIAQRNKLQEIANRKLKLIEKDISFQQAQTLSSQRLLNKNAISKEEYLKEEKAENQLQQQYQNQKEALIQNEIQINGLVKNLNETTYNDGQQIQKLQASIKSSISLLQNSIRDWGKNTAWVAPFDGKILFNKQLNISSFYKPGEASIVLVPKGNRFRAFMKVSIQGSGKIEKGQKVFIEFSDFPKNDFGMLEGAVKSITSVSKNEMYEVEIQLPKKLITTYKKEIPVKAILKGSAKIITKNKRLINRFFEKVINLIEK
jgi:multidrug resistance efflux pump